MNELKAKIEQIEKRNTEQRAVEEKKHSEEIQYLKKNNQQLKVKTYLFPFYYNNNLNNNFTLINFRYNWKVLLPQKNKQ